MDASSSYLGAAEHSSVMSKVHVSSYISEGDLGARFDERTLFGGLKPQRDRPGNSAVKSDAAEGFAMPQGHATGIADA
jgi:hypothetical protein